MEKFKYAYSYFKAFVKWIVIAGVVGIFGGVTGGAFHLFIGYATNLRTQNPNIIFFLPAVGLIIVFLYRICGLRKDPGTNTVISAVRENNNVPALMAPLIFVSTILTHLCGGSAGREGAALQLGGSISGVIGRVFKLDEKDRHTVILCGMSAVFSALFITPVTAVVFALEVISVGVMYYSSLLPCVVASFTACIISTLMGNEETFYLLGSIPAFDAYSVIRVVGVAIICGLFSIVMCVTMKKSHKLLDKLFPNDYIRVIAGGAAIILLTFIAGNNDYNGAGMDVAERALNGEAVWYAFILKLIFTAITIGSGYKGGEIVPTFFIGATLGCTLGPLVGLDNGFCAAVGLVAMFCGVVNCPVASVILSVELFGAEGLPLFAVACAVSYMLSGNFGLYSSQKIMHSKIKNEHSEVNAK